MFEQYFPNFDDKYSGFEIICTTPKSAIQYNYPNFGAGTTWDEPNLIVGYSTGRWGIFNDRPILQVLTYYSQYAYGWVYLDEIRTNKAKGNYNVKDLQDLVNEIITNNQKIVVENLTSAYLIDRLESKGIRVDSSIKNTIKSLQERVNERDQQLQKNEYLKNRQSGTPAVPQKYIDSLNKLFGAKIGVVLTLSVTTVIIIAAIIGAGIVVALFYAFKGSAAQSASDYKLAKKTQDILKKLSPEDAKQVEKEIKNSWNAGYKLGSKSSIKNIGLFAAGIGVFFLAKPIGNRLGLTDKK